MGLGGGVEIRPCTPLSEERGVHLHPCTTPGYGPEFRQKISLNNAKQIHFLGCKNISNYRFYLIWFSKKPHLKIKRRHFINSFSNEVPSAKHV